MIDPALLEARASEVCRCRHERAFHDPCSKCFCAFFLPKGEKSTLVVNAWENERRAREAAETDQEPEAAPAPRVEPTDGLSIPELARRLRKEK